MTPQSSTHKDKMTKSAGFLRRLGAWLYDVLIILALEMMAGGAVVATLEMLYGIGAINYGEFQDVGAFLNGHVIWSIAYPLYLVLVAVTFFSFFWCKGGQTLGMRAWKLRIQNIDGSNISIGQSLIRLTAALFGAGNIMVIFNSKNTAFQDYWAKCEMIVLDKAS